MARWRHPGAISLRGGLIAPFDKNRIATVSDWDGGLATLAGDCADPKTSAEAISALSAEKEYSSADPAIRAAKPMVSEVLIGY